MPWRACGAGRKAWGRRSARPPRFYLVLVWVGTAGLGIVLLPFSSMRALYLSAALNGLVAVPLLARMMILARRCSVMGRFVITAGSLMVGWAATLVMAAALVLVDSGIT